MSSVPPGHARRGNAWSPFHKRDLNCLLYLLHLARRVTSLFHMPALHIYTCTACTVKTKVQSKLMAYSQIYICNITLTKCLSFHLRMRCVHALASATVHNSEVAFIEPAAMPVDAATPALRFVATRLHYNSGRCGEILLVSLCSCIFFCPA